MRRLTLLLAGGAVWLFLAAIPVFADGGPHVASINSGAGPGGLTADSCAGCHRAHTAQGYNLTLKDGNDLCLVCHNSTGQGATTDVVDGVQYNPVLSTTGVVVGRGALLGALRDGGFTYALIGTSAGYRVTTSVSATGDVRVNSKVPPAASTGIGTLPVTSRHMNLDGSATGLQGIAWGNGPILAGVAYVGPAVSLECTSCHNPHGNNQYRILRPVPKTESGTYAATSTTGIFVTDVATTGVRPNNETLNYTVIQATTGAGYTLTATAASAFPFSAGNYLVRKVPWNGGSSGTNADAPNGHPGTADQGNGGLPSADAFNGQITAWCTQCHTRYYATTATTGVPNPATGLPQQTSSTDPIFNYRHGTDRSACTTCHVGHGSNAVMTGLYSTTESFPNVAANPWLPTGTSSTDSRLLKVDNRGTCQMCHDPTGTTVVGQAVGPKPNPLVP